MSDRVKPVIFIVLTVLCITPLIATGCTQCNGYKQLTVEEGIAHLSFEYPCNWEVGIIEIREDLGFTSITVLSPFSEEGDSFWTFSIISPYEDWPNAEAALEDSLSFWESEIDFEILDRSAVEVAGVRAEQVVFFCRVPRDYPLGAEPTPVVKRSLYFEYDGLIWMIGSSSDQAVAEADNVHFEHMLETFRILD
jgi:hypothetical protein